MGILRALPNLLYRPRKLWLAVATLSAGRVRVAVGGKPGLWADAVVALSVYVLAMTCVAMTNGIFAWRRFVRHSSTRIFVAGKDDITTPVATAPFAILVCGGEACRDECGARLAAGGLFTGETTLAFFSSGHYKLQRDFDSGDPANPHFLKFHGVDFPKLREVMVLDRNAIDTFANFTTFLSFCERHRLLFANPTLSDRRVQSTTVDVVVVTSAYHVQRARAVAAVVLGSQGLSFVVVEAVPAPAEAGVACRRAMTERAPTETWWRSLRDVLRAIFWIFTSFEGDAIAALMHKSRRDYRTWHRSRHVD